MRCLVTFRVALLAAALVLSACATTPTTGAQSTPSAPARVVYAAIGASETYGIGASDRSLQAWPQVFFSDVLPPSAVFYNFGIPGATTAQALHDEVPAAVAVHPTVVTVWLNVNDLISGVGSDPSRRGFGVMAKEFEDASRRISWGLCQVARGLAPLFPPDRPPLRRRLHQRSR